MNLRNLIKEYLMYSETFNKIFTKRFEFIHNRTIK